MTRAKYKKTLRVKPSITARFKATQDFLRKLADTIAEENKVLRAANKPVKDQLAIVTAATPEWFTNYENRLASIEDKETLVNLIKAKKADKKKYPANLRELVLGLYDKAK